MGVYLCIGTNGIPPSVSKRIMLYVQFPPTIHVPNQLVGAPLGTDVTLECDIEAFPKSINYWVKEPGGGVVMTSGKYTVNETERSKYEFKMSLHIRNMQSQDGGTYKCVAKSSLGEVESSIRLYNITGPTRRSFTVYEDINSGAGSSDDDEEEEEDNDINSIWASEPSSQEKNRKTDEERPNQRQRSHVKPAASSAYRVVPFFFFPSFF